MTIHSFHARHDHHRSPMSWRMLLDAAATPVEVVQVTRDYVASFTPHEIELLPADCRPGKIVDGDDVARCSYDLALHRWDDEPEAAGVIQVFASFFADATQRLAQIARRAPDGERESA